MSIAESCTLPPARPRRTRGNRFPRNFSGKIPSLFGRVCIEIWGADKPNLPLAARAGCTERQANLYIEGKTPPSYEALMAVLDELRPRKRA